MLDPWFKRHYPLKHLKKWLYWPWAEYRVLRDATAVLFTSEEERAARPAFVLALPLQRAVINYGTAAPPADDGSAAGRFRRAFPSVGGKRIILFLGRIHEKKGCELLIRAFAIDAARLAWRPATSLHLVFAGPDPRVAYRRSLERLISQTCPQGSVTWTGLLTGDLEMGRVPRRRRVRAHFAPGEFRHRRRRSARVRSAGAAVQPGEHLAGDPEDHAGFIENDDERRGPRVAAALDGARRRRATMAMRANAQRCFSARFDVRHTSVQLAATLQGVV